MKKIISILFFAVVTIGCNDYIYNEKLQAFCRGEKSHFVFDRFTALKGTLDSTSSFSTSEKLRYEFLATDMIFDSVYRHHDINTFLFDDRKQVLNEMLTVLNTSNSADSGKIFRLGRNVWFFETETGGIDYVDCEYSFKGGWSCCDSQNYFESGSRSFEKGTKLFLKNTP